MKRPFHNGGGGSFIKSLQLLGRPHRHSHRSLPNERHQATPNRRPTLFGNTSRRPTRTCRFLNLLCVVDVFRFAFAFGFAFGPGEVQSLQHLISWETPMHSSSLSLSLSYTETSTFFLSHRLYNSEDIYIRFICIAFHHDSHGQLPNACSPDPRVAHPGAPGGSRVASAEGSRWRCLKS